MSRAQVVPGVPGVHQGLRSFSEPVIPGFEAAVHPVWPFEAASVPLTVSSRFHFFSHMV